MVVPYTQLSGAASQPRFSSAGQKAAVQAIQLRGPQFGDRNANPAEHAQPSPKRSWLKTLLVGVGTLIGIVFAGKFAFQHAGGAVSKHLTAALGEEVVRDIGSRPVKETLETAGSSLFGKATKWLADGLTSDTTADFIIGAIKGIGGQHPVFKSIEGLITKENLKKALNPENFPAVKNAIETLLRNNVDSLSPILGENATALLKRLFTAA